MRIHRPEVKRLAIIRPWREIKELRLWRLSCLLLPLLFPLLV